MASDGMARDRMAWHRDELLAMVRLAMRQLGIAMDLAMGRLDGRLAWGRLAMDLAMGRLDGPCNGKARWTAHLGTAPDGPRDGTARWTSRWEGSQWIARDGTARNGTAWHRDGLLVMGRLAMDCLRWDGSRYTARCCNGPRDGTACDGTAC